MINYDSLEIWKLVGLYILFVLGKEYGVQNVGLYLDDALACLHKMSGTVSKKYSKISSGLFGRNLAWK